MKPQSLEDREQQLRNRATWVRDELGGDLLRSALVIVDAERKQHRRECRDLNRRALAAEAELRRIKGEQ